MSYDKQYKIFSTIADLGNITKAADKLFISQPYLSKLIKDTEEELGVTLFERKHRSVEINYAGEEYLKNLKELYEMEKSMFIAMDKISRHKIGRINLGINPTLASIILPIILPKINEKYPYIQIKLYEEDAITIESLLKRNIIDFAFGFLPIYNDNLTYEIVYEENFHFLVGKNSTLYNPSNYNIKKFPFDLKVLDNEPIITLSPEYTIRRAINDFYQKYNLNLNISLTTSSIYTAINLVVNGMASTFIPTTGMSKTELKNVNIYTFDTDTLNARLAVYYNKNQRLTPLQLWFIRFIKDELRVSYDDFYIKKPK